MLAMGAPQDPTLVEETFDYILNKARDQNLIYFFAGFVDNFAYRRHLSLKFRENYESVSNLIHKMSLSIFFERVAYLNFGAIAL